MPRKALKNLGTTTLIAICAFLSLISCGEENNKGGKINNPPGGGVNVVSSYGLIRATGGWEIHGLSINGSSGIVPASANIDLPWGDIFPFLGEANVQGQSAEIKMLTKSDGFVPPIGYMVVLDLQLLPGKPCGWGTFYNYEVRNGGIQISFSEFGTIGFNWDRFILTPVEYFNFVC